MVRAMSARTAVARPCTEAREAELLEDGAMGDVVSRPQPARSDSVTRVAASETVNGERRRGGCRMTRASLNGKEWEVASFFRGALPAKLCRACVPGAHRVEAPRKGYQRSGR